jgi:hypothetical protein
VICDKRGAFLFFCLVFGIRDISLGAIRSLLYKTSLVMLVHATGASQGEVYQQIQSMTQSHSVGSIGSRLPATENLEQQLRTIHRLATALPQPRQRKGRATPLSPAEKPAAWKKPSVGELDALMTAILAACAAFVNGCVGSTAALHNDLLRLKSMDKKGKDMFLVPLLAAVCPTWIQMPALDQVAVSLCSTALQRHL